MFFFNTAILKDSILKAGQKRNIALEKLLHSSLEIHW